MTEFAPQRVDTVVIGGGQAGLSVGYHLARKGLSFLILDAGARIGQAWRERWDSMRLFTPARYSGLDGMRFPAAGNSYPTKDEMADYLEAYAARFALPVRLNTEVDRVCRKGDSFMVAAGDEVYEASNVVVAMSTDQKGRIPGFARQLDPSIRQMHSAEYRRPDQLRKGDVLVVGAANSGAEIALELRSHHRVRLSGRHPGHIPFRIEGFFGRTIGVRVVLRLVFHRLLTVRNPFGRKAKARLGPKGKPLVRVKPVDLDGAGIERIPRVVGVRDGQPLLEDGRVLAVANVIWATGFEPGLTWIDIDVFDDGEPRHRMGRVDEVPGLFFVGFDFLYSPSSGQIHGVGRDAARIAAAIAERAVSLSSGRHEDGRMAVGG